MPNCVLIRNIAVYITNLLRTFGVITGYQAIGYPFEEYLKHLFILML